MRMSFTHDPIQQDASSIKIAILFAEQILADIEQARRNGPGHSQNEMLERHNIERANGIVDLLKDMQADAGGTR